MPVSKARKKKPAARRRNPQVPKRAAIAGARVAFQALDQLLATWDSPDGPRCDPDLLEQMKAFFLSYYRVLTNAGIAFEIRPIDLILNRIHYKMPVSSDEVRFLRAQATRMVNLAITVKDYAKWQESFRDVDIYAHIHKWEWNGIGEAQAGFSARA